jgi:hypothetical protein
MTAKTTTRFRIDLMAEAIGRYVLMSHNMTPTTISTRTTWMSRVMEFLPKIRRKQRL